MPLHITNDVSLSDASALLRDNLVCTEDGTFSTFRSFFSIDLRRWYLAAPELTPRLLKDGAARL